jgi:hypothetical protein
MKRARILTLLFFVLAALPLGAAYAQYPQPAGACSITPNQSGSSPNSTLTWTVLVLTTGGVAAPNVEGSVTITSGVGTPPVQTFKTGTDGKAVITIKTGANPGDISLAVTCGSLQTSTVLKVIPPAVVPKPPDTGRGIADDSSFPLAWLLGGIGLAAVAGVGGFAFARRRS